MQSTANTPRQFALLAETLANLVEVACEHDKVLDLMSFTNYLDLYRVHVQDMNFESDERVVPVAFELFIRDQSLLSAAANSATIESGEPVAIPDAIQNITT
ncbi:MAG: hypothetical protein V3U76_13195 [Granulosicoccus sp.]